MTFTDVVTGISGLTHYYPLTKDATDSVGKLTATNHGATFSSAGAKFDGKSYVELGDSDDFSVATKKALSVVAFVTIADWKGAGDTEYIHWMGKGEGSAHEWTFRHYVKGGTGEAPVRQGRTSFYHFNPAGGLGAGSYWQDSAMPTTERVIIATCDMSKIQLYVDGVLRDSDALSGYSVVPQNTSTPARIGTRDMTTGFLVGTVRRVGFFNRILSAADVKAIQDAKGLDDGGVTPPATDPYVTTGTSDVSKKHNALVAALRAKGVI